MDQNMKRKSVRKLDKMVKDQGDVEVLFKSLRKHEATHESYNASENHRTALK